MKTQTKTEGGQRKPEELVDRGGDPLSFLATQPTSIDSSQAAERNATGSPKGSPKGSSVSHEPLAERIRAEHAEAELLDAEKKLQASLRAMSAADLFDLRACADVDLVQLRAEKFLDLLILVGRILTLGLLRPKNVLATERQARQALAQRANEEIDRRRRGPRTAVDRIAALGDEERALRSRQLKISARRAGDPQQPPHIAAREAAERAYDAAAFAAGRPTVGGHRKAAADAAQHLASLEAEHAVDERELPGLFMGLLSPVRNAKLLARLQALSLQLAAARKRREQAALALQEFLAAFERAAAAEIEAHRLRIEAARKADLAELKQVQLELEHRMPQERIELDREALQQRLSWRKADGEGDDEGETGSTTRPRQRG